MFRRRDPKNLTTPQYLPDRFPRCVERMRNRVESSRNGQGPGLLLLSWIVRAVILPATPLLLPGLTPGLRPDPLATVRREVRTALAELTATGALPLVLAHGSALRHGRLRPSLAGSGIGDRWLPAATAAVPWADGALAGAPAGTGASVALLALADVLGDRAAAVETLEVPADGPPFGDAAADDAAADLLRRAAGLVVAGGGAPGGLDAGPDALTNGIRAALRLAGADTWYAAVQAFEQAHDHLPPRYLVTTYSDRRVTR